MEPIAMTRRRFGWGLLLSGCTLALAGGCGSAASKPQPVENLALNEVGDLYRLYVEEHQKPPTKPSDFTRYEQGFPLGYRQVKDGEVVVQWGAQLTDLADGSKDSADRVLAYEKKVPDQGGAVLMENRTLREMTAEEFKSAPKAGSS
jgi:hypothetical protein